MEMNPDVVAAAAALAMADELDQPDLPTQVKVVLTEGPGKDTRLDASTAISLAALTVAAAQLAWAIYGGLTGKGAKTQVDMADELGRRLKIQTDAPPETIETIVRHTTKALFKEPE